MRWQGDIEFDKFQLKLAGIIDLTEEEALKAGLDSMVIFVGAGRVGGGDIKMMNNGDVRLKVALTVSDLRFLTNGSREGAIEFLAGAGEEVIGLARSDGRSEADGNPTSPITWDTTVDIEDVQDKNEESVVVGHTKDYRQEFTPEPQNNGSGPKVAKFAPEDMEGFEGVGEIERVGSIYPEGHKGKDKMLREFMDAEMYR